MRIEKAGDLIFWTYYMVDWKNVKETPSDVRCAECGNPMNMVEPVIDSKGLRYDGYVCHKDKRVIWARSA